MFRTAEHTFSIAECTFRSGEYTFRSGERTYRSAEHRIDTRYVKIIIALVNTLRQLLSHIHYYYPHTIIIPILSRVRAHAHAL